MAGQRFLEPLV